VCLWEVRMRAGRRLCYEQQLLQSFNRCRTARRTFPNPDRSALSFSRIIEDRLRRRMLQTRGRKWIPISRCHQWLVRYRLRRLESQKQSHWAGTACVEAHGSWKWCRCTICMVLFSGNLANSIQSRNIADNKLWRTGGP
jgi:hypothetical protein